MQNFTENTKQAFEEYSKGDVKHALSLLSPGTEHYDYIKIVEAIKADKKGLSKDSKKQIKEFVNRYGYYSELFKNIMNTIIEMEEYDFLKELYETTGSLNFYYNHEKPYYAQNTGQKDEEDLGPNSWNQEDHFNSEKELKKVYDSYHQFSSLHKSLWNELDFNKFSDQEFEYITNQLETFSVFITDTFMSKFATYFKNKYSEPHYGQHYTLPGHLLDKMTLKQMDVLKKKWSKAGNDYQFKGKYFDKTYHYYFHDQDFYELATLEEKRDLLIRVLEEYKEDQSLRSSLLREILIYGIKLNIFYPDQYFLEYLKFPLTSEWIKYK